MIERDIPKPFLNRDNALICIALDLYCIRRLNLRNTFKALEPFIERIRYVPI